MSEQDDSTEPLDETADTDRVDDTDEDKPLGPKGERAYEAEKEKRKAATTRAREAEEERDRLKAELAKLQGGTDTDKVDADAIRKAARAEARAESLTERAMDKVEARAAKLFADPEDARALLAGKAKTFVDDDEIDVDAIDAALTELLKKKPHLAAMANKRFAGGADGGARKGSSVSQLTADDLERMTPEQIVAAKAAGRFNTLLGIKT